MAEHPKSKSTGGFYQADVSPCMNNLVQRKKKSKGIEGLRGVAASPGRRGHRLIRTLRQDDDEFRKKQEANCPPLKRNLLSTSFRHHTGGGNGEEGHLQLCLRGNKMHPSFLVSFLMRSQAQMTSADRGMGQRKGGCVNLVLTKGKGRGIPKKFS